MTHATPGEPHVVESRPPRRALGLGASLGVVVAVGCAVWAYVEYAGRADASRLSLALAGVFFGMAAAVLLGFRAAFTFCIVTAPRPLPPPPGAPIDVLEGRRGLVALLGAAASALVAVVLLPLRSLGGRPGSTLHATAWRRGVRLLTLDGVPLRHDDVPAGSATPVVPATSPGDTNSIAVLVRLRGSNELRAYSRICTHAGCAVCLFRADRGQLVCPCHRSTYDARDGRIVRGPASRPLPRLPLAVDGQGLLVADGDFDRPIGPRTG
jgi:Rieske Fe-S protein